MLQTLLDIAQQSSDEHDNDKWIPTVAGRILHADADILAYKACKIDEPFSENRESLEKIITVLRKLSGAEFVVLHTTMGDKSNRHKIAVAKEYQANRVRTDDDKSLRVYELKQWMNGLANQRMKGFAQWTQEADDSMCQAMYKSSSAVLYSTDKDLNMVPGMHLNPVTFALEHFPDGYGNLEIAFTNSGSSKVIGKGKSFFWYQMLAGDSADNIPGLPKLSRELVLRYATPKKITDLGTKVKTGRMPSGKLLTAMQRRTVFNKYQEAQAAQLPKAMGPMLAFKYLSTVSTDVFAYLKVKEAYRQWYGTKVFSYTSWDGRELQLTYIDMLIEQARLLWMQRVQGEDVKDWLCDLDIRSKTIRSVGDNSGKDEGHGN